MGPTLGQAQANGWLLSLKCERTRAGLKSVRACPLPSILHLPTLVASFGPDIAVNELRQRIRCPQCGSDRFELRMRAPPDAETGKEEAKAVPRRMQPARGPGIATLGNTPEQVIIFVCSKCGRRGGYRKETLLKEFDGDTPMPSLLKPFAAKKGCGLAEYDMNGGGTRGPECKIHYDIDPDN